MKPMYGLGLAALVTLVGCGSPPQAPPAVDLDAARQEILEADRRWSETWNDANAFAAHFAEDGTLLPAEGPRVVGPNSIRDFWVQVLGVPGLSLSWEPLSAHVADTGDLGYTVGTHEVTVHDAAGSPVSVTGKYLAVWRKQADGAWKIAADISNTTAPPGAGGDAQ